MKHTQGDWKAEWTHSESNIKKGWHIITGNYDDIIDIPNAPEAEANAKLIAAAPEMLSILLDLQKYNSMHKEFNDTFAARLNAAIQKATN
jgi:hypothetical protein